MRIAVAGDHAGFEYKNRIAAMLTAAGHDAHDFGTNSAVAVDYPDYAAAVAELLSHTQDVGDRFAEEARRMHYGESAERAIRGRTTEQERESLADEGIEVFTLPIALPDKGPLQ